eukprot:4354093-Pyramimonas_sp.AAC.1
MLRRRRGECPAVRRRVHPRRGRHIYRAATHGDGTDLGTDVVAAHLGCRATESGVHDHGGTHT